MNDFSVILNSLLTKLSNSGSGELYLEWPPLLLLLPIPLLFFLLPAAVGWRTSLYAPFISSLPSHYQTGTKSFSTRLFFNHLALWLIWTLLLISAARPFFIGPPTVLPSQARDMMMVVDISGSMEIRDMVKNGKAITRLRAVKDVIGSFIKRRKGDRLGLILFGSQPYLQAPLSFDLQTIGVLLKEAQLGFAGQKTAIGDGIALTIKRLQNRPADKKVAILLTDGKNTAGTFDPTNAAQLAAQAGVRIYTVGIGADYIPAGFFGRLVPNRELDENTLKKIAQLTGGSYFRARDPKQLEAIYKELDKLEPALQDDKLFRPRKAIFHWPLGTAFLCSLLFATLQIVSNIKFFRRP